MSTYRDVIALFEIGSMREQFLGIELSLMNVAGDIAPLEGTPVIGMPDMHFRALRNAESRLILLDADKVASVAGSAAGDAIRGYQGSFKGMHEAYGLVSGPDRTMEQAENILETLREVASSAHLHLTAYMARIKGLDVPTLEDYSAALGLRRLDPRPQAVEAPRPTTPRIRLPLDGDETAKRVRTALGYAFGGMAATYLTMKGKPERFTGMIALGDLSGVMAYVGAKASNLARRSAPDDGILVAHLEGISDDLDALYNDLEGEIAERIAPPEAIQELAATVLSRVKRTGAAIRHVERLADERGYSINPDGPSSPSP